MNSEQDGKRISLVLAEWYEENKRDLPWRATCDPYKIWLSEIILQQTRVDQGLSYYIRFTERFPTIFSFAAADEDEILKYWQGLGYYSRARNMHKTAREIVLIHQGQFPKDFHELIKLKGIGSYTAAAIASFAFDQAYPVVDGNVMRVLARIFNIDLPINDRNAQGLFYELATELLDKSNPGRHNQAIMEFGALQCKPRQTDCARCPLNDICVSFSLDLIDKRPVRKPATVKRKRFFHYLCISNGQHTWLRQRKEKDIWQNLWEFPLTETTQLLEWPELTTSCPDIAALLKNHTLLYSQQDLKHILTHQLIQSRFFTLLFDGDTNCFPSDWSKIELAEIHKFAVSRLTEIYLEKHISELKIIHKESNS